MASNVASGLYSRTFGYMFGGAEPAATQDESDPNEEYICLDYLERQSDIFVRWATKNELNLMSRAKAKLNLQKSTKHSFSDIELLLKHLEHSGRILVERISASSEASDENTIIKFVTQTSTSSSSEKSASISKKELALFSLQ